MVSTFFSWLIDAYGVINLEVSIHWVSSISMGGGLTTYNTLEHKDLRSLISLNGGLNTTDVLDFVALDLW